jgi:hypothetical protein
MESKGIKKDAHPKPTAEIKPKPGPEDEKNVTEIAKDAKAPSDDAFVDRPLDKALEILRAKLNEEALKKAA